MSRRRPFAGARTSWALSAVFATIALTAAAQAPAPAGPQGPPPGAPKQTSTRPEVVLRGAPEAARAPAMNRIAESLRSRLRPSGCYRFDVTLGGVPQATAKGLSKQLPSALTLRGTGAGLQVAGGDYSAVPGPSQCSRETCRDSCIEVQGQQRCFATCGYVCNIPADPKKRAAAAKMMGSCPRLGATM